MSTSAEALRDGTAVSLRAVPYDHPVAVDLVGRVQQEYVERYGGPDEAPVDPGEFVLPRGLFLVAEVAEVGGRVPAGCGAWRAYPPAGPGAVEIKRVYVTPEFRRRGLAQLVVAALETTAAAAGHARAVLNTGHGQPEALALYTDLGYLPVPGFGVYARTPGAVFLGKALPAPSSAEVPPWAS